MRILTASIALCLTACATTSASGTSGGNGKSAEPVPEKMAVVNNIKFDVAACNIKPVELATNETVLIASMLVARPAFTECLVDPKSRGPAPDTQVVMKAIATDVDVKFDLTSDNLSPSGKACLEKVLATMALKPLAKGSKPIEATRPFGYTASQGVRWGVNAASDLVATVRVDQMNWCDCYAPLATTPPPSMSAALHVAPGKNEVTMKGGEANPTLASCLEGKLKALALKSERDLTVNYPFLLTNGQAASETADAQPTFQFHQLDAIAQGAEGAIAMAYGKIDTAFAEYQDAARSYNAKPGAAAMKNLKEKCAAVLASDDSLKGSLDTMKATYERTQTVVGTLKGSDPAWAQVETQLTTQLGSLDKQFAAATESKKAHSAICAKLK